MGVDLRLILVHGDVSEQREHLDLVVDLDLLVRFALAVEVAEDSTAEGADRSEAGQLKRRAS